MSEKNYTLEERKAYFDELLLQLKDSSTGPSTWLQVYDLDNVKFPPRFTTMLIQARKIDPYCITEPDIVFVHLMCPAEAVWDRTIWYECLKTGVNSEDIIELIDHLHTVSERLNELNLCIKIAAKVVHNIDFEL